MEGEVRSDRVEQVRMDRGIAGNGGLGVEVQPAPLGVGDHTSSLFDDEVSGGAVPRLELVFPISIDSAGSHPAQVQRRRANPANPLVSLQDRFDRAQVLAGMQVAVVWKPGCDQGAPRLADTADGDRPPIETGAASSRRRKRFAAGNIDDDARHRGSIRPKPDRDRNMGKAVEEVDCAVDGVTDPHPALAPRSPP